MLKTIAYLSFTCFALINSISCYANTEHINWANTSQFLSKISAKKGSEFYYIAVNESVGIALLNRELKPLAVIARKAEHLDFRWLPGEKSKGVMATLDVDSGELLLIDVNVNTPSLTIQRQFKPDMMAFDALCLQRKNASIDLFLVDAQGIARHFNVINQDNQWQPIEINHFPVGPNIKACAVVDQQKALLLTEENIGVWRYSTNPEHEVIRELITLPQGLEIEYIDTTPTGDIAVVSPDSNTLWYYQHHAKKFTAMSLSDDISPKTVQLYRQGNDLQAFIYDDNQSQLVDRRFTTTIPPVPQQTTVEKTLKPFAQTEPVNAFGDAADDPAIWVNKENPAKSIVFTTDKKFGLNTYDLQGKLIQSMPVGRINNIDIRYDVQLGKEMVDIAAASNRTTNSITLFAIDKLSGRASLLNDIKTDLSDPYGLCLSKIDGVVSAWINDTDGRFQQYQLSFESASIKGKKVDEWRVPSQPEGCVVDDKTSRLFYGEEAKGVWLKHINKHRENKLIIGLDEGVKADIEGMGLYTVNEKNYLVVSSQGNNRYAVYTVDKQFDYLGTFSLTTNWTAGIDGASETDGLAVNSTSLGSQLPHGLLVVQDGHNVMPSKPQNFKYVDGALLRAWIISKTTRE